MNSIEFETALFAARSRFYRHRLCDPRHGFRPVGGSVSDFCTIAHQGVQHFFGIERRLQEATPFYPGHEIYFFHASTVDFITWQVHDPALLIRPGTWEGGHLWAPAVIRWKDGFVMAYTGVNAVGSQDIGLAFSTDLVHWERSPHNPISPVKGRDWGYWREDAIASCRDPHLFMVGDRLHMTYTANTRLGASCVALASSTDLRQWQCHGPILTGPTDGYALALQPGQAAHDSYDWSSIELGSRPQGQLESSNLFRRNDRWYLLVQEKRPGTTVTNWIYESSRMDRFDYQSARDFWPDAYTVEFVAERGSRSLLATAGAIRLGVVDWAAPSPVARFISEPEQLREWCPQ